MAAVSRAAASRAAHLAKLCAHLTLAPLARAVVCPSQIRHHLQAFLSGGVAALSFGYYQVHQDVWKTASVVDSRLAALSSELVGSQAILKGRIVALEGEIAMLKGSIAESKELGS